MGWMNRISLFFSPCVIGLTSVDVVSHTARLSNHPRLFIVRLLIFSSLSPCPLHCFMIFLGFQVWIVDGAPFWIYTLESYYNCLISLSQPHSNHFCLLIDCPLVSFSPAPYPLHRVKIILVCRPMGLYSVMQ